MGPVFAKMAGEDRGALCPAQMGPGAQGVMPPACVPTGPNATLLMGPAPAALAGRGHTVTSRAPWEHTAQAA